MRFLDALPKTAEEPVRRPHILVVDDSEAIRSLIERILQPEGYVLRCAADGRSALRLLETETFDLVLTDLFMPGMDGIELIRQSAGPGRRGRVVVLSGADGARPGVMMRAAELLGAVAVLSKPVSPADLRETVRAALANETAPGAFWPPPEELAALE